jgi:archaellum component FlaC
MKNFLNLIRKGTFPFIIAFSALSVSASAAFYSVSGLSKLFAGAAFEVIIMAGSLEVAKLVIASLLYQYWDTINKVLRTYLSIATVILVLITSMGIYGFLSAAYQDTYRQLIVKENQISFLDQKKEFYEKDVARYDQELERISNNISTLSNAKATQIQVRDTTSSTGLRSTVSTAELRLSQQRIEVEEENRKDVQAKREIAADSLQKYQLEILDLENNAEVAGELGPLQYLSNLTGVSMDKIINYLLLVIIFVFDPLAISLVVAANFAFANAFPKRKEETSEEWDGTEIELEADLDDLPDLNPEKDIEVTDPEIVKGDNDFLSKLDEIEARMVKDTLIEEQDKKIQQQSEKIEQLENEIEYAHEEINELDRAAIQIVDGLKHIDDYLKHHGAYYDKNGIKWDQVKLGFAEESDYIDKRKLRSKPKGKNDPYLDKNKDPDYPKGNKDNTITY